MIFSGARQGPGWHCSCARQQKECCWHQAETVDEKIRRPAPSSLLQNSSDIWWHGLHQWCGRLQEEDETVRWCRDCVKYFLIKYFLVILLHTNNCCQHLINAASQHYNFQELMSSVETRHERHETVVRIQQPVSRNKVIFNFGCDSSPRSPNVS